MTAVHRGMIQPQAVGRTALHQMMSAMHNELSFAAPEPGCWIACLDTPFRGNHSWGNHSGESFLKNPFWGTHLRAFIERRCALKSAVAATAWEEDISE
jgi:hypothetical protein